jgi:hypothetical protein
MSNFVLKDLRNNIITNLKTSLYSGLITPYMIYKYLPNDTDKIPLIISTNLSSSGTYDFFIKNGFTQSSEGNITSTSWGSYINQKLYNGFLILRLDSQINTVTNRGNGFIYTITNNNSKPVSVVPSYIASIISNAQTSSLLPITARMDVKKMA